ncbi:ribosome maturation factor RimP [Candidatus Palauibacter polyketidifaciens]|uniref:ribosome maturation factor RimP n=1 Tax=Candidatus Palauibacter polyketidifaciens TaxID=3056740 RepID=UPI00238D9809|nr:ribosome maturation factor RimP [Candidatus Palauibacter polyketidifaciens]MDE2721075.1 ribosome maturation factor RimP [Candidatus Palauibacter polyketidifaciens]
MLDSADIERAVEALGFEVVQMERGGGRRRPLLRLRIDRPGPSSARSGVTVDDCVAVTRELRGALEDGAADDWVLEVSSPGVDRPLVRAADYDRFAGARIRVRGYGPLADRGRKLEGTLLGTVDGLPGTFALEIEGDRVEIPLELVASARLVYDWDAARGVGGR